MVNMTENIKFEFYFTAEFWDLLPKIDIFVNHLLEGTYHVDKNKYYVCFFKKLDLNQSHLLSIKRYNKNDSQCTVESDGTKKDQYIIIDRVVIDGIDIQNLIWDRSWYEPEYPEVWKQQQISSGIELETSVPGEVWLSHNGIWYFKFRSPFYQFVIDQFR